MRHLTYEQALSAVAAGRTIEQSLGFLDSMHERIFRWLSVSRDRDGDFRVATHEVLDVGLPSFLDVYAFPAADPDEPAGVAYRFDDARSAIEWAIASMRADRDRFVNAGVIQDEYSDSRGPKR